MANQRGESTSIGHFWNRCIDAVNNLFETYSFWTHAKDVEFDDGEVAQNKVGAINGITSDYACEDESMAASITSVSALNNSLGGFTPIINESTGQITGYKTKVGADTVFPFSRSAKYIATFTKDDSTTIDLSNYNNSKFILFSAHTIANNNDSSVVTLIDSSGCEYTELINDKYNITSATTAYYSVYVITKTDINVTTTVTFGGKITHGERILIGI